MQGAEKFWVSGLMFRCDTSIDLMVKIFLYYLFLSV